MNYKICFILGLIFLIMCCNNGEKQKQLILDKSYVPLEDINKTGGHLRDYYFYKNMNINFLMDTIQNNKEEEFILKYDGDWWERDSLDNYFVIKILVNKIENKYKYYRLDFISTIKERNIQKYPLKSNFNLDNYFIYYRELTSGTITNQEIIAFLKDSLHEYKDRVFGNGRLTGYRPISHFKFINDTLKCREYDLGYFRDEKGKILERLVTLIKEETSK